MVSLSVLALFVIAFAGCLDSAVPLGNENANEAPAIAVDERLKVEAKDCIQAGGNSVYGGPNTLGPFPSANQLPELGNPRVGAFGATFKYPGDPAAAPNAATESWGIWHVATMCKTYTYMGEEYQNFNMGWIAVMIERPDFDVWGEPRIQFVVADLSFNNDAFANNTKDATGGAEISKSTDMVIEWYAPEKYMHVIIQESNHGTFDFSAEIHNEFGKKESEHIRFWMLPRTDGMSHAHGCEMLACEAADEAPPKYRPISIDIFDTATGGGTKLAGESLGTFIHVNGEEQHQGNPLGHYQDGFDRTIIIGPAPEGIEFEKTWLH
ncbi:MAG TPA: hypothetical protein VGB18_08685 [Candidatus Thermoplasmatota archaeon]